MTGLVRLLRLPSIPLLRWLSRACFHIDRPSDLRLCASAACLFFSAVQFELNLEPFRGSPEPLSHYLMQHTPVVVGSIKLLRKVVILEATVKNLL